MKQFKWQIILIVAAIAVFFGKTRLIDNIQLC